MISLIHLKGLQNEHRFDRMSAAVKHYATWRHAQHLLSHDFFPIMTKAARCLHCTDILTPHQLPASNFNSQLAVEGQVTKKNSNKLPGGRIQAADKEAAAPEPNPLRQTKADPEKASKVRGCS